jgi:hypothetical protein
VALDAPPFAGGVTLDGVGAAVVPAGAWATVAGAAGSSAKSHPSSSVIDAKLAQRIDRFMTTSKK